MDTNNVLLLNSNKVFKSDSNINGKPYVFKTSSDAIITLKEKPKLHWSEMYLEYDLLIKNDGTQDTAMPFVSYICEQAESGIPITIDIIYVTSSDAEKSMMIEHALRYYGYTVERNDAANLLENPS